jgi:hypothetical protein
VNRMPLICEDFSAWIEVDGAELSIFDVQKDGQKVTGWIPSESGKNFSVKWSVTNTRLSSMSGDVYIDGTFLSGMIMRAGAPRTFTSSGVSTSATTEKPFVFSRLELTDDDNYLNQAVTELGDIKLIVSLATIGEVTNIYAHRGTVGKVHERSKKATGHKVGLGEEKVVAHTSMLSVKPLATIATFIFKYRPLDMLRAQGIAPPAESIKRAASSTEPEVLDLTNDGQDSDDDNEGRIRALREELASLERKRKRQKRMHVKSEPRVKREPGSSAAGRNRDGRNVSLGVVDLT